nr:phage protein NinX family protein [Burkholderia cenocepacia]
MRTDELGGTALDYWCARALCADDEDTLRFTAIEPKVIVTAACDALRRLDAHFSPSTSWADAGPVLERVGDLRIARRGDGVECDACFIDGPSTCTARAPDLRTAVRCCARSCVRASATRSTRRRRSRTGSRAARPCATTPGCRFPKATAIPRPATARISARFRGCDARRVGTRAMQRPLPADVKTTASRAPYPARALLR